uniref:Uncharacterized protein n=1 Tax=Panagrolaimus sp. ES5 TaxID=591445 RepID=A0AC34FCT2_9BILA
MNQTNGNPFATQSLTSLSQHNPSKRARPQDIPANISYPNVTAFANDLLKSKEKQLQMLHDKVQKLEQEKKLYHNVMPGEYIPTTTNVYSGENISSGESLYVNSVVITNIDEQIDELNAADLDKNQIVQLAKEIELSVTVESVTRVGKVQKKEYIKFFIKQNQIYFHDTLTQASSPMHLDDPVNDEAAYYYNITYSFRAPRQRTTTLTTNQSSMEV